MTKGLLIAAIILSLTSAVGRSIHATQAPQYIFTATAIAVDSGQGPGLCVAIDPADPNGVWWWQGRLANCSSRSTFSREGASGIDALFHPKDATVLKRDDGAAEARFRVPMHSPPDFVDVDLIFRGDQAVCVTTGSMAATKRVTNLDIPPTY